MKPTCIAYTNTNEYNIQTCGFHQTLKNKLYSDEKQNIESNSKSFIDFLHKN